jgi:electron transfer flavoprotein alpha subunit
MAVLIIAEHDNLNLNDVIKHLVTAARKLDTEIHILVAGFETQHVAEQASALEDVSCVLQASSLAYQHQMAENIALLVQAIAPEYKYIIAPTTTFGKNILPRIAALMDTEQISEVIDIISENIFVHPIYAGNALETIKTSASKIILTIRPTAFVMCQHTANSCKIKNLDLIFDLKLSKYLGIESSANNDLPDLSVAPIVVAGGRGLHSKDDFEMLKTLARKLHAAIGASRAAVDAGLVPNDWQIGQTGKVVAPNLYIAVGISGAIQHLAGMKDSKIIVAINKDPDAPIFKIADYGLVADLYQAIPELTSLLEEKS